MLCRLNSSIDANAEVLKPSTIFVQSIDTHPVGACRYVL